MKKTLYLFTSGTLERKDNTIFFSTTSGSRALPINAISELMIFGEIELNKRVLEFLNQYSIPLHFFNYYGFYIGSFYPRETTNSGIMTLKQAEHYLDMEKRLYLAKSFVYGGANNILCNIDYYRRTKTSELKDAIISIENLIGHIDEKESMPTLMELEAEIRKIYYSTFDFFLEGFTLERRTIRPPTNPLNAMLSFGNSLLYVVVLSEIYKTHLDPRIGFLHTTNQRSFSLNLDIAEIFKPIIVDRIIFSLVNKGQIQDKHFEQDVNYAYLNQKGREIFVNAFEEKLRTTIKYKNLGKVSYRRILRIECYKLYQHFLDDEPYKPFISNW
ncbi:MAG: type I-B CRISPR-associated endonuclease Cas1b [Candidatus Aenigmatarchaeota archaeon]